MQNRAAKYFRKDKAMKIIENPLAVDLKTLLSATLALSRSQVVKKHINNTLVALNTRRYKLSA